jgi:hypothetical protein
VAAVAVIGISIGLLACAAAALTSSGTKANRKTMKGPGRNGKIIDRDDFEEDPKAYFRKLHKK